MLATKLLPTKSINGFSDHLEHIGTLDKTFQIKSEVEQKNGEMHTVVLPVLHLPGSIYIKFGPFS